MQYILTLNAATLLNAAPPCRHATDEADSEAAMVVRPYYHRRRPPSPLPLSRPRRQATMALHPHEEWRLCSTPSSSGAPQPPSSNGGIRPWRSSTNPPAPRCQG